MICTAISANKASRRFVREVFRGIDSRLAGKPGGATSMNLFSTKNHGTRSYVRNANMWLHDLRSQITCAVAWKQISGENIGGVLISPYHVLYCRHSYPDAFNPGGGRELGFVLADGTYVYGIQISQAQLPDADLCVATLDRNMQALGVHVVPIWGGLTSVQSSSLTNELPLFAISQSGEDVQGITQPESNYPIAHDVMCYLGNEVGNYLELSSPRNLFDYAVYVNDSGTPKFILYKDTVYLFGIIILSNWYSVPVYNYIASINNAIIASDDLAIANGDIASRTNQTVSLTIPLNL